MGNIFTIMMHMSCAKGMPFLCMTLSNCSSACSNNIDIDIFNQVCWSTFNLVFIDEFEAESQVAQPLADPHNGSMGLLSRQKHQAIAMSSCVSRRSCVRCLIPLLETPMGALVQRGGRLQAALGVHRALHVNLSTRCAIKPLHCDRVPSTIG